MWSAWDGIGAAVCRYLLIASISAAGLVVLAWVVIRLGRIRAAVYRHSIWLYCLAGIVAVPLLWIHAPKLKLAVLPSSAPTLPAVMELPDWTPPARSATLPPPASAAPVAPPAITSSPSLAPPPRAPAITARGLIALLWALGVALMLLRLAVGWFRLRGICRAAAPLGISLPSVLPVPRLSGREPRILVTPALSSPVCCGVLSPVILLPEELVDRRDPSRLRMALSHELAHVQRRDIVANALQRLVESLLFFHPLVWYASRLLTQERERLCDNWVVAQGADADRYAEFLAELAERATRRPRLVGVALCENGLLGRVKDLLDPRHARLTRLSRWAALACAAGAMLAFGVFGVLRLSHAEEKASAPLEKRDADYADMLALYPDADKLRMPTAEEIKTLGALWPSVPPEQNAAYYFAKAGKALSVEGGLPEGAAGAGRDRPYAGDLAAVEQWVARNRDALGLLREGTRRIYYRSPLVWDAVNPQPLPLTQTTLRQVTRAASDAAFVAEMQGRPAEAVALYADCLRAGTLLRRQGVMLEQLVGMGICVLGERGLAALTANATLDEATLREVIGCLREAEVAPNEAAQAFGNEVAYADAVTPLRRDAADAWAVFAAWRAQRAEGLKFVSGKTLAQLLQSDAMKAFSEIGARDHGAGQDLMTLPTIRAFHEFGRCDTRLKAQEIRAALMLYRQTHGGVWPESLDALVPGILPAIPIDPYSGKPMRYARAGDGWKVWSVGADNADDGGRGDPDVNRVWDGPDYVFVTSVSSNLERRSEGKLGYREFTRLAAGGSQPGVAPHPPATHADMLAMYPDAVNLRMPTAEEMKKLGPLWPQMPPEENAAYWYDRAALRVLWRGAAMGSAQSDSHYFGDAAAFASWIRANGAALEMLKSGLARRACARPVFLDAARGEVDYGFDMGRLGRLRALARVVYDAGFNEELQGRPDAAAEWYMADVRMGAQTVRGTALCAMVGRAVTAIGCASLNSLVANSPLQAATLRRVIAQARESETSPETFGEILGYEALTARGRATGAYVEGIRSKDMPLSVYIEDKTTQRLLKGDPVFGWTEAADWAHLRLHLAMTDLELRTLQVRAAIALFQQERGRLPGTLAELVPSCLPAAPADPFDGKALRYAKREGGWKLWSVGRNRKDEGGKAAVEFPDGRYRNEVDCVFPSKLRTSLSGRAQDYSGGDPLGLTPLHVAANRGDAVAVARLLREGADVRAKGKTGQTALHMAATAEVAKLLLDRGADPVAAQTGSVGFMTPVQWAIVADRGDVVEVLWRAATVRGNAATALRAAVEAGRADVVMLLLRLGASSKVALGLAVAEGDGALAERLLAAGAVPDEEDIASALQRCDLDMLEFFVARGTQPDFFLAAALGQTTEVRRMVMAEPALLKKMGPRNRTALHWAAFMGQRETVALLISMGADVNSRQGNPMPLQASLGARSTITEAGMTPLHLAAMNDLRLRREPIPKGAPSWPAAGWPMGRPVDPAGTFRELLARGADVNALNDSKMTPLMVAALNANTPATELLIAKGADIKARSGTGRTALDYAKETHTGEVVRMLEKAE
jgi:ankyrin repeat protein/beta-lactamase regulating signal transducer with metallopeptidase domain